MTLKGYVAYHKSGTIDYLDRAHGGVSIFIKSNLPQSFIDVTSPLQAIVVKVEEDLHGSDHFPIILESHYHPPDDRPPKLQFHRADWNLSSRRS